MAELEKTRAAMQRARDWWNSLSDEEQSMWRQQGLNRWDAFWMALRCRQGRARATDICPNGNGNGSTNGNNDIGGSNGNGRATLPRWAQDIGGPLTGPLTKTPRMPDFGPPSTSVLPGPGANGNGNGNGMQTWFQNPWVWAALAGGGLLLATRRKPRNGNGA